MKTFNNLGTFGAYLMARVAEARSAAQLGLKDAGLIIETEAKARIGQYQAEAGPFNAWAPLSEATLEGFVLDGRRIPGKTELGYAPPDNPLLRTGDLRLSYGFIVSQDQVTVGSDSLIAVYQEMGTPNARFAIPPRPVLGPAAFAKAHEAVAAVTKAVVDSLSGLPYSRVRPGDTDTIPF